MFVIFPAEELILMTYGAAIPRIAPRPTLDCLREPKVPLVIPARSLPPSGTQTVKSPAVAAAAAAQVTQYERLVSATNSQSNLGLGEVLDPIPAPAVSLPNRTVFPQPYDSRHLLPTIDEQSSLHELPLAYNPGSSTPPRRGSRLLRSKPVQKAPISAPRIVPETPLVVSNTRDFTANPSYNDLSMRSSSQPEQLPPQAHPRMTMPEPEYPTGFLQRERSPSIYLDEPDPTQPRLGPGWGRPMSPMEFPPEPSTSQKSPTSKSRLRPKLHIPLGRLGRSTSSDQRESYRLREDLELQVENPVFNTENLRQRNFDAFFDSGEPVYKLQPKTPHTAAGEGGKVPLHLDNYAGVYDSSPRKGRGSASGGLFSRSQNKHPLTELRSISVDQSDLVDERADSLDPGSVSAGNASSSPGVPQKGDRFLGKIFKWSKKS